MNKSDNELIAELFAFPNGDIVAARVLESRERIRGAFSELFSGYNLKADTVLNETVKVENYSGLVIERNIHFYTFCEHHFLPFFGTADLAYEPNRIITGLGKLVRLVKDVHARRLQIQEIMTQNIAEDIMRVLNAKGTFVRTRAKHLCICSRGPRDDTASTEVIYRLGSLSRLSPNEVFGAE